MGSGSRGTPGEGRPRVVWSPRGRRRWCPGAGRTSTAATTHVPTGWTSYLHLQTVLDALRGRRASEPAQPPSALPADLPRPEPRAPLPDRRRRTSSEEPALDGWLDRTPD